MSEKDVFVVKKDVQTAIKNKFMFPRDNKFTGLIHLSDTQVLSHLIEGLRFLPVNFVVVSSQAISVSDSNIAVVKKIDAGHIPGLDFIVCDNECEELGNYLKNGVVPIVIKDNYLSSLLSEFNPMKNEGNSFLYEKYNEWTIFHALSRYMENAKFPFDHRNLVKNVLKIQ